MIAGDQRWSHRSTAVYLGDETVLARLENGQKIYLNARDRSIAPHLMLDGYWEKEVTDAFLDRVTEGMWVVDIGANCGYYTLLAGKKVGPQGHVWAFEPMVENVKYLERSVDINGLTDRTTIECRAVTERTTRVRLWQRDEYFGDTSIYEPHRSVPGPTVLTTSLDDYFQGPRLPALIKVDAEGAEMLILRGATRLMASQPHLTWFMELNIGMLQKAGVSHLELLALLVSNGYTWALIRDADDPPLKSDPAELDPAGVYNLIAFHA